MFISFETCMMHQRQRATYKETRDV